MRARHLQEGFYNKYTAVLEIRRTIRTAKDKTLPELFNDCSSLSVTKTPSQLDSWRTFEIYNPKMNREQFVFFQRCHRLVSGPKAVVMLETASIK